MEQVSAITYGSDGDIRSFGYDPLHQLTSDRLTTNAGAAIASIDYGDDANGNITSRKTAGFTGSTTNTYTYDQANRLLSWDNGSTTTAYDYDQSGNRIRVGSNVYTYDARDQLTSDGQNTYEYTARGTRLRQNDVVTNSDAYGQTTASGTQRYTYDALGRTLSAGNIDLSYSGIANDVASDGANTYSRDPGGALLGINSSGDKRLAFVDQRTDVVGTFTAQSVALTGSTTYDPLGNVLTKNGTAGNLGYQSGWTDPASGNVNMASRWYNPANGQFMNKDTVAQDPVPNSAAANPFAYVSNNPILGTDPSGHGWLSAAWNGIKTAATATWNFTKTVISTAWNYTKQAVTWVYHESVSLIQDAPDQGGPAGNRSRRHAGGPQVQPANDPDGLTWPYSGLGGTAQNVSHGCDPIEVGPRLVS